MNIAAFNWVDYLIAGILFFSALLSLARGFIHEAFALLVWIVGVVIAFAFAPTVSDMIHRATGWGHWSYFLAFMGLFVVVWIIGVVLTAFLRIVLSHVGLGPLDRLVGLVFGVARGVLLVTVLLLFSTMTGAQAKAINDSQLAPHFAVLVSKLKHYVPSHIQSSLQSHVRV